MQHDPLVLFEDAKNACILILSFTEKLSLSKYSNDLKQSLQLKDSLRLSENLLTVLKKLMKICF